MADRGARKVLGAVAAAFGVLGTMASIWWFALRPRRKSGSLVAHGADDHRQHLADRPRRTHVRELVERCGLRVHHDERRPPSEPARGTSPAAG